MNKKIYGVGINDLNYTTTKSKKLEGKKIIIWKCPFHACWSRMIARCYCKKTHIRMPSYTNCRVCDDWLYFSKFKSWMESQDWENKHLDKDLLISGNKKYSPETCVFLDKEINLFLIERETCRGEWPIGVIFHKQKKMFMAQCNNPFTKTNEYLGLFICPEKAHLAWKARKHEHAIALSKTQNDLKIKTALITRYV